MKNYLLLLAVAATVSFTSCSKDDDDATPAKSKTEYLTASGWKVTSVTVDPAIDFDGDGTKETDLLPFSQACNLDDLTVFKTDQTYTEEEGATKCDPNDPQVYTTGTWAFSNNENTITLTETGSTTPNSFTITQLNDNTLQYTESFTDPTDNVTYTVTITSSH